MAGGIASIQFPDDARVQPGEKIWRLIPKDWYLPDPNVPNGSPEIHENAFSQDVSVLRACRVSEQIVDSVLNGQFAKWGILELNVDDIRAAGCVFEIEVLPEWDPEAHFNIRRLGVNQKFQRPNPIQKRRLAVLANKNPLRRVPRI
jgi:hypothetical protein